LEALEFLKETFEFYGNVVDFLSPFPFLAPFPPLETGAFLGEIF
jgi:hypothetical protein